MCEHVSTCAASLTLSRCQKPATSPHAALALPIKVVAMWAAMWAASMWAALLLTAMFVYLANKGRLPSALQVASQVHHFLLAGYETTAAALGFCVYHIARTPRVEAALLAEVDTFGRVGVPTFDDLDQVRGIS